MTSPMEQLSSSLAVHFVYNRKLNPRMQDCRPFQFLNDKCYLTTVRTKVVINFQYYRLNLFILA